MAVVGQRWRSDINALLSSKSCTSDAKSYMETPHKRSMRQHCALKHGIFKEFLAEFLGTFVLVVSKTVKFSAELNIYSTLDS